MLKLSLIEFFFRLIPEGFLLALSIYAFSSTPLNRKRYIASAIILSINIYLVRMLPINFGVHTIIIIMIYILVAVNVNRIEIMKAIKISLLASIILSICDAINFFIIVKVLNISIEKLFNNIFIKILLGLPSLVLFFVIVFFFYKRNLKKAEA